MEPIAHVLQCLQGSVSLEAVLALTEVNALWLARYRTNDIAGPLYFEGHFDLHTQQYVREADALLNF